MKKFLNRRNGVLLAAVLVAVAFFSFKSGDDRNFQIAKIWIPLILSSKNSICFT